MSRKTREVVTSIGRFECFRGDAVTNHLVQFGAHTRNELAMVLSFLRPGDRVLDVGAHIGTFSIPMAACVGSSGKIYAFEGSSQTYDLLRQNVQANDTRGVIEPHFAVVSDRPARYTPVTRRANTGATFFRASEDAESSPPCVVLDNWFSQREDKLDFMKIDVEGMELQVLRGSRMLLSRYLPVLYVEINTVGLGRQDRSVSQLETDLSALGYHFFRNADRRNSSTDSFSVAKLEHLYEGGEFFDLLAVHPDSDRYPDGAPRFDLDCYRARVRAAHSFPTRVLRRVRRMVAQHGI